VANLAKAVTSIAQDSAIERYSASDASPKRQENCVRSPPGCTKGKFGKCERACIVDQCHWRSGGFPQGSC
jgi:hypothetical protein